MSEIEKVTRLLELATLYRLREELDLASTETTNAIGPDHRMSPEEFPAITEIEKPEPVRG